MTSTSSRVSRTRSLEPLAQVGPGLVEPPGVSTRISWLVAEVTMPWIARVVCGFDDVIATLSPPGRWSASTSRRSRRPDTGNRRYPAVTGSAGGVGTPVIDRPPVASSALGRSLDDDGRDAVPSTLHPLGGDGDPDLEPRIGAPAEFGDEPPTVSTSSSRSRPPGVSQVVDKPSSRDPPAVAVLRRWRLPVVLVGDLADDSSRMSSMVTRPAVPPYSSTTTATCTGSRCISLSRSSIGLLNRGR